jgi:hypothetical protein
VKAIFYFRYTGTGFWKKGSKQQNLNQNLLFSFSTSSTLAGYINQMGKKKKGKKKKSTGGNPSADGGTAELIAYDPTDTRRYIHVSMHMENWSFADKLWPKGGFWLETKTRLFILHKMIKQRHGAVQNMRIWKLRKTQENLLLGEMKTLSDLGFQGEIKPSDRPKLEAGESGSPPGTAASTASGDGGGEKEGDSDDGVTFEDGMVAGETEDDEGGGGSSSRPMTGATDATEDNDTAPEDDYEHIRLIYDFTPANLDDPLLLISPRV